MAPSCFRQGATGVVAKVAGMVGPNFSSSYEQSHFKRQKKSTFSELLLLQSTPEAVISLCNEMSSGMVKTLRFLPSYSAPVSAHIRLFQEGAVQSPLGPSHLALEH